MTRLMFSLTPSGLLRSAMAASVLTMLVTASAQAASFTPFSFTTNRTASPATGPGLLNDPTRDIRLDSIVTTTGRVYSQFEVVNAARILQNDTYTAANGQTCGSCGEFG
jgi:hypothetical protein